MNDERGTMNKEEPMPEEIIVHRSSFIVHRSIRIANLFKRLKREARLGLIAYVTCGDPDAETTIDIALALERAGADALELGIPFSDPIADGPVIQAAAHRALQRGTTTRDMFTIARAVRSRGEIQ